jgi:hypothetical protein
MVRRSARGRTFGSGAAHAARRRYYDRTANTAYSIMRHPVRLLIVIAASTATLLWLVVRAAHALIAALRLHAPAGAIDAGPGELWASCNPVVSGLAILIGVVIAAHGLDTRGIAGTSDHARRRARTDVGSGYLWRKLLIALAWIAAGFAMYIGSCLYPEGSS